MSRGILYLLKPLNILEERRREDRTKMERKKLIGLRKRKGWTVAEAAEHVEVDDNTLYKWEKGKATPHGYNIGKLCKVYGVTEEELGLEKNEETAPQGQTAPSQSSFVSSDLTMKLLALAFSPYKNFQGLQHRLTQIIKEYTMTITRRDALRRLATLPAILSPLSSSEGMGQYAASVAACWELSKSKESSDLVLSFESASTLLIWLDFTLKNSSSSQRKAAAELAAQCAMIQTFLGWHLQGPREAASYAKRAIEYGEATNDIPIKISARKYLAWAYSYDLSQAKRALDAMNEAVTIAKAHPKLVPMTLHGNIYSSLAYMQAKNHQDTTAALLEAERAMPYNDEGIYCDSSVPLLMLYTAMTLYQQEDYEQAQHLAEQIIDFETLIPKVPLSERRRIEIVNVISEASLKRSQKDLDLSLRLWKEGVQGARQLQSEQRFHEAALGYTIMEAVWPGENRIKELRELTEHW